MALIQCPECGGSVSDHAVECPRCGFPIDAPNATPRSARKGGEPPQKSDEDAAPAAAAHQRAKDRSDWSGRLGCLVVLLLLTGLVAGAFYYEKLTLGTYTPKEADAYEFAVTNIKNKLKARNFVMFPKVNAVEKSRSSGNTYTFHSEYHTKDVHGEQVSKPFTIVVRYIGDGGNNFDDWTVVDMRY